MHFNIIRLVVKKDVYVKGFFRVYEWDLNYEHLIEIVAISVPIYLNSFANSRSTHFRYF